MNHLQPYDYDPETLRRMLAQADAVEAAIRDSVREALLRHKRLGQSVVSWENGQVVWIPADQIPVDDCEPTPAPPSRPESRSVPPS